MDLTFDFDDETTTQAFAAAVGALREEYEGLAAAAQQEHEARMAVRVGSGSIDPKFGMLTGSITQSYNLTQTQALRTKAERDREAALAALEAQKGARLEATKAAHALELAELKARYNTKIEAQRGRVDALKAELGERRRRGRQDEQRLLALRAEKAARAGPLARAAEGLVAWEAAVAALEDERGQLRSLEASLREEDRAVRALERDADGLRRRLAQARAEVGARRAQTQAAVLRAQQRAGFGVLLLENKLRRLQARVDAHRRAAAARAEAAATVAAGAWVGAGVVVVVGKAL